MNIEIPLLVLKLGGFFKPRYLVLQVEVRGATNTPTIVYARPFYSRSRAQKAAVWLQLLAAAGSHRRYEEGVPA